MTEHSSVQVQATNAASSGIQLDKKTMKQLMRRSDRPGVNYLAVWIALLAGSGALLYGALQVSLWAAVPAMVLYGTILTVPSYALSHECSHGTAFKTRWLNEAVLFATSILYLEGPYFRRYAHARHHTYTWMRGLDAQMPFHTPVTLKGFFLEISGVGQYLYDGKHLVLNALGRFEEETRGFTPESELPKLKWEARVLLAIYLGGGALAIATGAVWVLIYLVIPRLLGAVVMQLFTFIQHAEMEENHPDIRRSTRSFRTNALGRFLYANMCWHVEHHLYPTVPFHSLKDLNAAIAGQLPAPDRGLFKTNWTVFKAIIARALGRTPDRTPALVEQETRA